MFLPGILLSCFQAASSESDMTLALNRYLCGSILPLLTNHSFFFMEADHVSTLLESTLNTVYRLSKCKSLTKGQREMVSDFLVAFTKYVLPLVSCNKNHLPINKTHF